MNRLANVREGRGEVDAESLRLLRNLTVMEGLAHYLAHFEEVETALDDNTLVAGYRSLRGPV